MNQNSCQHSDVATNVSVTERTFKDGTKHLERRCVICQKHLGYQRQTQEWRVDDNPFQFGLSKRQKRAARDRRLIHFGKYQGKTWDAVAATEDGRDYCNWFLRKPDLNKGLRRKIEGALMRVPDPTVPYVAPPMTPDRESAIDKVNQLRQGGLDFILSLSKNKQNEQQEK